MLAYPVYLVSRLHFVNRFISSGFFFFFFFVQNKFPFFADMPLVSYYSGLELLERKALITTQTVICLSQMKEKMLSPQLFVGLQWLDYLCI